MQLMALKLVAFDHPTVNSRLLTRKP